MEQIPNQISKLRSKGLKVKAGTSVISITCFLSFHNNSLSGLPFSLLPDNQCSEAVSPKFPIFLLDFSCSL